jgi:hypothetical protein
MCSETAGPFERSPSHLASTKAGCSPLGAFRAPSAAPRQHAARNGRRGGGACFLEKLSPLPPPRVSSVSWGTRAPEKGSSGVSCPWGTLGTPSLGRPTRTKSPAERTELPSQKSEGSLSNFSDLWSSAARSAVPLGDAVRSRMNKKCLVDDLFPRRTEHTRSRTHHPLYTRRPEASPSRGYCIARPHHHRTPSILHLSLRPSEPTVDAARDGPLERPPDLPLYSSSSSLCEEDTSSS